MRHPRPTAVLLGVVTATLATTASLSLPARAAAPSVELQPQELARGADIAIPHIEDGDFVDGARRVELPGTVARVIGPSGGGWLVGTNNVDRNRNRRVVRVEADGSVVDVLRDVDTSTVILSADGSTLAWQQFVSGGRKAITYAASAADGRVLGEKGPGSPLSLLDVDASKVVLAGSSRVLAWRFAADRTRTVVRKRGDMASIEHDLLSIYTKDPYLGGCMKVVRFSDRTDVLWRSCRERIAAFSPDGTRMLTFHILTDGLGPGELRLREVDGSKLATYTTNWFSGWEWETPDTLLLDVNGARKFATVRCSVDVCENATDPVQVQAP